ncbi:hypothetical protein J7K19_00085 [bacterium]|nr:hypothetical protein [bacterium]
MEAEGVQEKKGILWGLGIPEEVETEYTGVKLGEYYADPEIMLQTQLKTQEIFRQLYDFDKRGVGPAYSSYVEASMLGAEVIFPEDNVPMVKEPVLKEAKDVYKLKVLDPYKEGLMSRAIQTYRYMKKRVGDKLPVNLGGTEGPITTAVILRGQDFFIDLFLHPKEAHKLLALVTEVSLMLREVIEKVTGEPIGGTGICDDFSGLLSPEQYEEFAFPYQKQIYEAFGHEGRGMHSELLRREHLKFLPRLGVTSFDPGMDQYLTIEDIKTEIDIHFSWNLKTSDDILQGTPETIRAKYEQAVAEGAPEIVTELCRGVPRENVRAFIEVARRFE